MSGSKVKYQQKDIISRRISGNHCSEVISKVKVFKKMGQTPRSRSQGKKCWYAQKDLVTKNTHVKY